MEQEAGKQEEHDKQVARPTTLVTSSVATGCAANSAAAERGHSTLSLSSENFPHAASRKITKKARTR